MFLSTRLLAIAAISALFLVQVEYSYADSTTYTIKKLAGVETGLVKLAHIDDTIALGKRDDVWIDYQGPSVPGSAQGLLFNCDGLFDRKNCDVYGTAIFENPGMYSYTVSYISSGLLGGTVELSGSFIVEEPSDFVIVSVGDSVASGEGNPAKPLDRGFVGWNDIPSIYEVDVDGCHRSSFAGPVRAVKEIAKKNAVSFFHIPCTGAKLADVQAGDVANDGFNLYLTNNKLNTQLHWAHMNIEQIDVLLLSGGANNAEAEPGVAGFGEIVLKCLTSFNCADDDDFEISLTNSISALGGPDGLYADFSRLIEEGTRDTEPTTLQIPSVVAITEYFDPTRNEDGDFPSDAESALCTGALINRIEWEFLYEVMVQPLNEQVHATADLGWTVVDGIEEAFRTHGYCASPGLGDGIGDSWVIKAPESLITQGDQNGTAHPDRTGHSVTGDLIYDALVRANPPRTWALAWTEGSPYQFGTWVNTDVEVTLQSYNPIQESGVSMTLYRVAGIDDPICSGDTQELCKPYGMPFVVSDSGRNLLSSHSINDFQAPETRIEPVEILIDKDPPVMTCSANQTELWAPNKTFTAVTLTVTAVDEVSGPADYWLSEIKDSYEQVDSAIIDFELNTADVEGEMLADRHGKRGARHYTLTYSSVDHVGNLGSCDAIVTVPHDQRVNSQKSRP